MTVISPVFATLMFLPPPILFYRNFQGFTRIAKTPYVWSIEFFEGEYATFSRPTILCTIFV